MFGTLLQWLVYGNHPSPTAAIGMALIIACGVYAAVSDAHSSDQPPLSERDLTCVKVHGTANTDEEDCEEKVEYAALPFRQSHDMLREVA